MASHTPALLVNAKAEDDVVYYHILSGETEATATLRKTTRYSELSSLHAALLRESPQFSGVLPRKTLRRNMTPAFVESRRLDIESYLRTVVAEQPNSKAWQEFFGADEDVRPARPIEATADMSLTDAELLTELSRKETQVSIAKEKMRELEDALATGENSMVECQTAIRSRVATDNQSLHYLEEHRQCLNSLATEWSSKKASRLDKASEQRVSSDRLAAEFSTASAATEAARAQLESARRERHEAVAVAKAHVARVKAAVLSAEQECARADELKVSTAAVMNLLKNRARARAIDAASAERVCAVRTAASREISSTLAEALRAQQLAEEQAVTAAKVLSGHKGDALRRERAHEAHVRRAEEYAARAAVLRDMRSRSVLATGDNTTLADAQRADEEVAKAAFYRVREAKASASETSTTDQKEADALAAAAKTAADHLSKRTHITEAIQARCRESEETVRVAEAAYGAAKSASDAAESELRAVEARHAEYVTAHAACVASLDSARESVSKAQAAAAADQVPLRHMEEAEASVLARREAAEAAIVQALDAARTAAVEGSDHAPAQGGISSDADVLVTSCQARLADRERDLHEADTARTAAEAALSAGREELSCQRVAAEEEGADDSQLARAEARCTELEKLCHEKNAAHELASAAVQAVRVELETLEAQEKMRAKANTPIDTYVTDELSRLEKVLEARGHGVATALTESDERAKAWADERDRLAADLHRAKLELNVAEEGLTATKLVKQSLEPRASVRS